MDQLEYNPDLYTLVDEEDGTEQVFELLDVLEENDERYFAMLPYYEDAEEALQSDAELVVLKAEMVDGEEMMATIQDDDEYERIGNIFLEKLSRLYEEELESLADDE